MATLPRLALALAAALLVSPRARAEAGRNAAKAAPYVLPWQLRPAGAVTAVRLEDVLAWHEDGFTNVTVANALIGVLPQFSLLARVAVATDRPDARDGATVVSNPIFGGLYALEPREDLRLALTLTLALPIGMGGGNNPDPAEAAAMRAGALARSAMDNSFFGPNDLQLLSGVDVAWIAEALVLQAEASVIQLVRLRGAGAQPDAFRTNSTAALFAGRFFGPHVSLGAELRYQRWLSTPTSVAADPSTRDNLSAAVGLRAHVHVGAAVLRPGVAFGLGLHGPLAAGEYRMLHLDVPVVF